MSNDMDIHPHRNIEMCRPFFLNNLRLCVNHIMNTSPTILQKKTTLSYLKLLFLVIALAAIVSGCATNQEPQQQSNDQTTVSGYIDMGAQAHVR
jgi:hypothetical protein